MRAALLSLLVWLLDGAPALGAGDIGKWRTPDGGLYFGSDPPAGSTPLGTLKDSPTRAAADPAGSAPAADEAARAGREILQERGRERQEDRARRAELSRAVAISDLVATRGNLGWQMNGAVENSSDYPVHNVRVGAGRTWTRAAPADLEPGQKASFQLYVEFEGPVGLPDDDAAPRLSVVWNEK
jgi:hypothetical protein